MSNKAKIREDAENLKPIDDPFFEKMAADISFCQELLQTVLEDDELLVLSNTPQFSAKNLQGRSCVFDLVCKLSDGNTVIVEVQKADDDDHQRRMRYIGALMTTNITNPGIKFKDVPDVIVVLISKFDIFKSGHALYHVDRIVRETGALADNGLREVYVNAETDDATDVAELMKIFTQKEKYNDEKFPAISKRKRYFKMTEEGVREMCEIIERNRNEAKFESMLQAIQNLMKNMNMSAEKAMTVLGIAPNEFGQYNRMLKA